MLTSSYLKSILDYDKETGIITWIKSRKNVIIGSIAGTLNLRGYWQIGINKKLYTAHRLAWLYEFGEFPLNLIDHINGVKTDNRINNLRDVTATVNAQNILRAQSNSKTKLLGVYKSRSGFSASINTNGVKVCLGTYTTAEDAHKAYIEAKSCLHDSPSTTGINKNIADISSRSYKNSLTNVRGVTFHKFSGLYRAEICINRKRTTLGYFNNITDAEKAYTDAKQNRPINEFTGLLRSRGF